MDTKKVIDLIGDAVSAKVKRKCAKAGQVTLGELMAKLEGVDPNKLIKFDDGTNPGGFYSYRGYYEMIAIDRAEQEVIAGVILFAAKLAIGHTYEGYKGGDLAMTK